ncbi:uncharacterized protein LOC128960995, partial [Oppia nitens]|uniref:uncharacterized protein LOC128960995 n=1 Tax=Oppia nitens TaxID=1686743 RepID=UPI0023DC9B17
MFETFLNAILIVSVMLSVICDHNIVIRNDRIYRYVGNESNLSSHDSPNIQSSHEMLDNKDLNKVDQKTHDSIITKHVPQKIPESFLIQMKDIKNSDDFIDKFLTISNHEEHSNDVFVQYLQSSDTDEKNQSIDEMDINEKKKKLTKLPKIASPAGCIPEKKIIELETPDNDNELYYPSCIRISRCSGCCSSERLQCVALNTSFEDISVIRVKYSSDERRLKFEGFKVFRIERHDRCVCDCIQKAFHCKPNQVYSDSECRCLCPNVSQIIDCQNSDYKQWDYNLCECKCKSIQLCSTGFVFNNNICRCEPEIDIEEDKLSNGDHPDVSFDINDSNNKLNIHHYVLDKKMDNEMNAEKNKDFDVISGINPDINDNYQQTS